MTETVEPKADLPQELAADEILSIGKPPVFSFVLDAQIDPSLETANARTLYAKQFTGYSRKQVIELAKGDEYLAIYAHIIYSVCDAGGNLKYTPTDLDMLLSMPEPLINAMYYCVVAANQRPVIFKVDEDEDESNGTAETTE